MGFELTTVVLDKTQVKGIRKVQAISLESYIAVHKIDRVLVMKMDCEGAEFDVVTPSLLEKVDNFVGEFHNLVYNARVDKSNKAEALKVLVQSIVNGHVEISILTV